MSEWTTKAIGELLESNFPGEWGADPSASGELVRVFRGADFVSSGRLERDGGAARRLSRSKLKKVALRHGDLLLEKSGGSPDQPVGRVSYFDGADGPAAASNFLQTLRPSATVDSKFLFYLLQREYARGRVLPFQQQTTGIINFRLRDYLKEQVKVPVTLDEQRRIADLLSAVDAQIEATSAVVSKLSNRYSEVLANLTAENRKYADSLLLRDCVEFMRNGTTAAQSSDETPWPVTRIETIADGAINWSKVGYLQAPAAAFALRSGDILYSHINSIAHIGKSAIYEGSTPLYHGMNLMLLRPNSRVLPKYLFYILNSERARRYARGEAKQAVNQASLDKSGIGRLKVYLPNTLSRQRDAVLLLDGMNSEMVTAKAEMTKLSALKQGLLTALLSPPAKASVA